MKVSEAIKIGLEAKERKRERKTTKTPDYAEMIAKAKKGQRWKKVEGYKRPMPAEVLNPIRRIKKEVEENQEGGSNIKVVGSSKNTYSVEVFGCASPCMFVDTDYCPHGGKHHNGICSFITERISYLINAYKDEEFKLTNNPKETIIITRVKAIQMRMAMDNIFKKNMEMNKSMKGEDNDALGWSRLVSEELSKIIKHEEGSKVAVEKKGISPGDLADMLYQAKIVEAEVKGDVKEDDN